MSGRLASVTETQGPCACGGDVPPLAVWRLWNDIGGASHSGVPLTSSYQFGGELWWPPQKTQACLRMRVHVQGQVRGLGREVLGSSTSWCPTPWDSGEAFHHAVPITCPLATGEGSSRHRLPSQAEGEALGFRDGHRILREHTGYPRSS